jgi:hypothetical protein
MRALNVLLACAVSLVLGLLVIEGGLRLFPEFRPQETINRFDERLGWSKKPGASVTRSTREFTIHVETNGQGLRDDPAAAAPRASGTARVLALGDSFVLGYTVERADLFVDLLERWWQAEGRALEVVNAGTEGWSTDQQVAWFLEHGAEYAPDVVLLFPYENDIYWCSQERYARFPKPRFAAAGELEPRQLVDPGPASRLSRTAIGNLLAKLILPLVARGTSPSAFQVEGTEVWIEREFAPLLLAEPAFLAESRACLRGALVALQRACAERGARLAIVPIPSESAIHAQARAQFRELGLHGLDDALWSPDRPVETFLALARELEIPAIDLRDELRTEAAQAEELLYFDAEWHFNPRGNLAFARALHAALDETRVDGGTLLPAGHEARTQVELAAPVQARSKPLWPFVLGALWICLGTLYARSYRDEKPVLAFLKVGALLAIVASIFLGVGKLSGLLPPAAAPWVVGLFVLGVFAFVVWKLGRRVGTIVELLKAFTLRGHWYLMPLVVVLVSVGSLLVVAASSPLIAPFIYTLF